MEIKPVNSDINAVLAQMRALRDQATQPLAQGPQGLVDTRATTPLGIPSNVNQSAGASNFGNALVAAIDQVSDLQKTAGKSANDFVLGKENDLVKVMIDSQKSTVGFQAMVQVRNRMVTAYQDVMNMPI